MPELGALFRILVAPRSVYPLVRQRAPIVEPLVFTLALHLVAGSLMAPALSRHALRTAEERLGIPSAGWEDAMAGFVAMGLTFGLLGVLGVLAGSAALLAVAGRAVGARLEFRQALSLVAFARVPMALGYLALAGLVAGGVLEDPTVTTNAASWFPGVDAGTTAYRVLSLVDPLEWWGLALVAGGVAAVAGTTRGRAWALTLLVWLLVDAGPTLLLPPRFGPA